eukprot:53534-Eustigmatos_ZCMA.PRE.1
MSYTTVHEILSHTPGRHAACSTNPTISTTRRAEGDVPTSFYTPPSQRPLTDSNGGDGWSGGGDGDDDDVGCDLIM